ncbi:hypothetical protein BST79_gp035 [Only Syngen Nebraska virus 5]|uniref:hypothetical protein n=1 Tax=Only Syngen Nebraska virus 5 TaxID=1917232 RepID=UPI000900CEBF|nr:hypothetical protein BST79_gp035 [Only Syngen Nebraska virus 5]APC25548.1 hypothetical protein [Only Syngen Nebraska virus 5]
MVNYIFHQTNQKQPKQPTPKKMISSKALEYATRFGYTVEGVNAIDEYRNECKSKYTEMKDSIRNFKDAMNLKIMFDRIQKLGEARDYVLETISNNTSKTSKKIADEAFKALNKAKGNFEEIDETNQMYKFEVANAYGDYCASGNAETGEFEAEYWEEIVGRT